MKRNKAFTLIELVSVLVILAILALIVTPLVLNIIRKARTAADKRSIDAYGRSIELAIADYLLDNGTFPTSIDELQVEYTGDRVECSTTQLNSDSSVYLAECTVDGRTVSDYTYGKDSEQGSYSSNYTAYEIGQTIEYNGVNYYVINNSSTTEDSVTLLKAEPLTYEEVQTYSNGTGARISDNNGIGGMQYGQTSDYSTSYVKIVVDAWKAAKAPSASEARLLTYDELIENLGYNQANWNVSYWIVNTEFTPSWVYNSNYNYWTMSAKDDSEYEVWRVIYKGDFDSGNVSPYGSLPAVRPVITIQKSALN